jgi:hypothetical protein
MQHSWITWRDLETRQSDGRWFVVDRITGDDIMDFASKKAADRFIDRAAARGLQWMRVQGDD